MTKVYDIQGNKLNIGDTVAFSYATNKSLVIGTVNKIGELVKRRGYHNQFIGTRINIGHTSIWADSKEQVLLIKKKTETLEEMLEKVTPENIYDETEVLNPIPSHKKFLAIVNYEFEAKEAKGFDTDGDCKIWLWDKIKMWENEDLLESHNMINQPITDMKKIAMYNDFYDYADDWNLTPHILTWNKLENEYK